MLTVRRLFAVCGAFMLAERTVEHEGLFLIELMLDVIQLMLDIAELVSEIPDFILQRIHLKPEAFRQRAHPLPNL